MNETRSSAITARPSMYSPMASSTPAFCHHVHVRTTGSTNASPASSLRWIHWTPRPVASTVAAAIEATPSSRALHRQALAEEDDDGEGDPRDDRDQPGVLEEPPRGDHRTASCIAADLQRDTITGCGDVIPSSPRVGRGRSSGGCGRRAAPSPGRRRPRRRRRR